MKQNYDFCLKGVLRSEGGYTNDRTDPGGPTNYGITIADYRMYVKKNATASDVKKMTLSEAEQIYKSKYWDKVNGDNLPSGIDYAVFDYGVNSGVSRALRIYNRYKDQAPAECINSICDERLSFLRGLRTWGTFGKGWSTRVASVRKNSLSLAKTPGPSIAAGAMAGSAGGLAAYPMWVQHWPLIVGASIVGAIIIGIIIHYIRKKG